MSDRKPYPHCVLAWETNEAGELQFMRLLTADEFNRDPKYAHCSWRAYSPEGTTGPYDKWFTSHVDRVGLEAAILDAVVRSCSSVPPGVLNRLDVDLRRFRIDDRKLEMEGFWGKDHGEMIANEVYAV